MADPADTNAPKVRGKPFQPGQVANPAGRPKGSRNKLGEDFIQALAKDFETHGEAVIATVRTEKPADYVKVIASLLPKHVEVKDVSLDELDRSELADLLDAVRAARRIGKPDPEGLRH